MAKTIVYQGEEGAFSHLACQQFYPDHTPISCPDFAHAFALVREHAAALAMIPVENTVAGRVSDIYHLLPNGGLFIIAETYLPVHHCLLGVQGARLTDVRIARSHPMALDQVRHALTRLNIRPKIDTDTASSARKVATMCDKSIAAVASELAAKIYQLDILAKNIQDASHNTTRFLVLASHPITCPPTHPSVTSFVFKVKSLPSALYKALGGFATNHINITKLESYMVDGNFTAAQFYIDVEAHPDNPSMQNALDELAFFSESITMLGTYPADKMRSQTSE